MGELASSLKNNKVSRRGALSFIGASAAVVALAACSGGNGRPEATSPPLPTEASRRPSPSPTRSTAGSQANPGEASPSPTPTRPELVEVDPAGDWLHADWETVVDADLADRIREAGLQVETDSRLEGVTDRRYAREAMVIGVLERDVRGDIRAGDLLHVALAPDESAENVDEVQIITVPSDQMPDLHSYTDPEGTGAVNIYPFRIGLMGVDYRVAILSGTANNLHVEDTYLKNPEAPTINGTHGYAPLV